MENRNRAQELLVEAGLLPGQMPDNYTFRKVKELLAGLAGKDDEEIRQAITIAVGQEISGPLATMIFIKHHLGGVHEVEIDRLEESEEGVKYAVLVYPEGELPLKLTHLPQGVHSGSRLQYSETDSQYQLVSE
jgi:hypothetical protein